MRKLLLIFGVLLLSLGLAACGGSKEESTTASTNTKTVKKDNFDDLIPSINAVYNLSAAEINELSAAITSKDKEKMNDAITKAKNTLSSLKMAENNLKEYDNQDKKYEAIQRLYTTAINWVELGIDITDKIKKDLSPSDSDISKIESMGTDLDKDYQDINEIYGYNISSSTENKTQSSLSNAMKFGKKTTENGITIKPLKLEKTSERNQFEESKPKYVITMTYKVINNSTEDLFVGSDIEAYDSKGTKLETYPLDNTIETIKPGKNITAKISFGINHIGKTEFYFNNLLGTNDDVKYVYNLK